MAFDAEIQFDHENWDRILKAVQKKWKDIEKRKQFGTIIQSAVYKDIMDHFEKERGPDARWQEWSKIYEEHLARLGRAGNKILQFTGNLRQRFSANSWRAKPEGILFYNNAKTPGGFFYAAAHNEGGGKLPKRQFMWLSPAAMKDMINVTEKWLAEDFK